MIFTEHLGRAVLELIELGSIKIKVYLLKFPVVITLDLS